MSEQELWNIIEEKVKQRVGSTLKLLSYIEIYNDLLAQLIMDLSRIVDQTKITPDIQSRLDSLEQILTHSSIDFDDLALNSPYEVYKIPMSIMLKQEMRKIQKPYLDIVLHEEGLI